MLKKKIKIISEIFFHKLIVSLNKPKKKKKKIIFEIFFQKLIVFLKQKSVLKYFSKKSLFS